METQYANLKTKVTSWHERYNRYYPAAFFLLGFLFDIVTLSRIDDWLSILQQGLYLIFISRLLHLRILEHHGLWTPSPRLAKIWHYNNEALHFVLGSLLSSYTLFYFVSSSIAVSTFFLILMLALLVANEFPQFQEQGPALKVGLYSLCLMTFFSYLIPILLRFVGVTTLLTAVGLTVLISWSTFEALKKKGISEKDAFNVNLRPTLITAAALLVLYFAKVLPPIPLSLQYIGVYHNVEKNQGTYMLSYERPFWRFWQNGAQTFLARPGDRVYCFASVFSPGNIDDQVIFHWQKKIDSEWQTTDRISVKILGGRDEGYRVYSMKSRADEGHWRVFVETTEGREIGRITFTIEGEPAVEPGSQREFKVDTY